MGVASASSPISDLMVDPRCITSTASQSRTALSTLIVVYAMTGVFHRYTARETGRTLRCRRYDAAQTRHCDQPYSSEVNSRADRSGSDSAAVGLAASGTPRRHQGAWSTAECCGELPCEERLRQCRQRPSACEAALDDQLRGRARSGAIGGAEHGVQGAEVRGVLRSRLIIAGE